MLNRRDFLGGAVGMAALTGGHARVSVAKGRDAASSSAWTRDRIGGMARHVELLAYHDLGGREHAGFQMVMQEMRGRFYLYCAHWAINGISVLDVTDPGAPRLLRFVPEPSGKKKGIAMVKLQVRDGIGITNMQMRKFDQFFGPQPAGTEFDEGLLIWDFKDPEAPTVISRWHSQTPFGTHRNFYKGGRYVHLAAGAPGYRGFIYRILDIANPANPQIVGEWAHPEQSTRLEDTAHIELHMPYVEGNVAYCAYWGVGMVMLDITDVAHPKLLSTLRTHPPLGGGSGGASVHTVVPYAHRQLAIISTEGERPFSLDPNSSDGLIGLKGKQQPVNVIGVASIADPLDPVLISLFPKPSPPPKSLWGEDYSTLNGVHYPFGNHNVRQPQGCPALEQRDERVYCSYFTAGLRIFDTADPYAPQEIAAYCPPDPKMFNWQKNGGFPGPLTMCAEDILVDRRGVIYMTNSQDGLHILRATL